ncbi:aldo/keto reductase [Streptomyces fuscigenes]|uniref:aldo/keto reductase n=1 Tax=Streptomyces fuscigenes TaxID=1528880 RepID=UPI001F332820|nr:aldo/keto reductase [Streptomyces fuscigenes]MCF3961963.1 aldo/keto reductase [Streptomyces fuscigenes]
MPAEAFGRSGLPVTALGFGAATLGGLFAPISDEEAHAALQAAWDAGIRYFDTAPHYGVGLSEERLGRFLADKPRDAYVLSTKVGRLLEPGPGGPGDVQGADGFHGTPNRVRVRDYSADGVRRSLDASLERLGLDRIDIAFIHDPDDYVDQALTEAYPALAALREQGVLASVGVGMNQVAVPTRFVRETDLDCLIVAGRYTLLDGSAAAELLPLCAERGVDVVGAGVFNSGLLATPEENPTFDYAAAPEPLVDRARAIAAVCARHGVPLPVAALAFVRAHPAVRTVLAGMRSAAEVRQNVASVTTDVPPALWEELRAADLLPKGAVLPGA